MSPEAQRTKRGVYHLPEVKEESLTQKKGHTWYEYISIKHICVR